MLLLATSGELVLAMLVLEHSKHSHKGLAWLLSLCVCTSGLYALILLQHAVRGLVLLTGRFSHDPALPESGEG